MNNISKHVNWKSDNSLYNTYNTYSAEEYDRKKYKSANKTVTQPAKKISKYKNNVTQPANKISKYKNNVNPSIYNFSSPHFYLYHYN
jgi:hypothetical protein